MAKSRAKQPRAPRKVAGPRQARARSKTPRAGHGQVGQQTYEHVRKLVAEKGLAVGKAFEEVAKATGRKAGTIAVTYYRLARRQVAAPGKGRGRPKGSGSGRRKAGGLLPGADKVLRRASIAIRELEEVIADQAREIARLTGESKLAARIRKALRE